VQITAFADGSLVISRVGNDGLAFDDFKLTDIKLEEFFNS
jgi:hypothetical protein